MSLPAERPARQVWVGHPAMMFVAIGHQVSLSRQAQNAQRASFRTQDFNLPESQRFKLSD
jgi:hypothetical protein